MNALKLLLTQDTNEAQSILQIEAEAELSALVAERDEWKRRAEIAADDAVSLRGEEIIPLNNEIAELKDLIADLERLNRLARKDGQGAWSLNDIYQGRIDAALGVAVCPSCTWRGDVELVDGVCPQCETNWKKL